MRITQNEKWKELIGITFDQAKDAILDFETRIKFNHKEALEYIHE